MTSIIIFGVNADGIKESHLLKSINLNPELFKGCQLINCSKIENINECLKLVINNNILFINGDCILNPIEPLKTSLIQIINNNSLNHHVMVFPYVTINQNDYERNERNERSECINYPNIEENLKKQRELYPDKELFLFELNELNKSINFIVFPFDALKQINGVDTHKDGGINSFEDVIHFIHNKLTIQKYKTYLYGGCTLKSIKSNNLNNQINLIEANNNQINLSEVKFNNLNSNLKNLKNEMQLYQQPIRTKGKFNLYSPPKILYVGNADESDNIYNSLRSKLNDLKITIDVEKQNIRPGYDLYIFNDRRFMINEISSIAHKIISINTNREHILPQLVVTSTISNNFKYFHYADEELNLQHIIDIIKQPPLNIFILSDSELSNEMKKVGEYLKSVVNVQVFYNENQLNNSSTRYTFIIFEGTLNSKKLPPIASLYPTFLILNDNLGANKFFNLVEHIFTISPIVKNDLYSNKSESKITYAPFGDVDRFGTYHPLPPIFINVVCTNFINLIENNKFKSYNFILDENLNDEEINNYLKSFRADKNNFYLTNKFKDIDLYNCCHNLTINSNNADGNGGNTIDVDYKLIRRAIDATIVKKYSNTKLTLKSNFDFIQNLNFNDIIDLKKFSQLILSRIENYF